MYAIQAQGLKKAFGNINAVDDVSFDVKKGEIFGFLGPNGAGKTTTIRMLTGILPPDSGHIEIEGIDIVKDGMHAKAKIGVIPETGNVYTDLTAKQNLSLAGKFYGMPKATIEERSIELLTSLGLIERKDDLLRTFSKGMRQRVSIACAIIHKPKVLFLDEPTEGLDVQSRRMVIETIYRLNDMGSTIFLTTHNIEEANRICERVCIINRGKIVAIDNPEKLKGAFDKSRSIEVAFDVDVKNGFFDSDLISKVMPCGDKTRVYTDEPDRVLKFIVEKAGEQDLKILSLSTCGPSLEETFVRLTGEG